MIKGKANFTQSPTLCPACGEMHLHRVAVDQTVKLRHEGRLHDVHVSALPIKQCANCGATFESAEADEVIRSAFRAAKELLQPDEIRAWRLRFNMTQEDLANQTGLAGETISRWENGYFIQSRAHDKYLRLFFADLEAKLAAATTSEDEFQRSSEDSPSLIDGIQHSGFVGAKLVCHEEVQASSASRIQTAEDAANSQYALAA